MRSKMSLVRISLFISIVGLVVCLAIGVGFVAGGRQPVLADGPEPTASQSLRMPLLGKHILVEHLQDQTAGDQGGLRVGEVRLVDDMEQPAAPGQAQPDETGVGVPMDPAGDQGLAGPASVQMSEGFEGTWPATGWQLLDSASGAYAFGKRNCHPHAGSYGGWSVGGGASGSTLACSANYPNNLTTLAMYGPFSLSNATAASLTFYVWGKSQPPVSNSCLDAIIWGSATNQDLSDLTAAGTCGDGTGGSAGNGYYKVTYDLSSRLGASQVWLVLGFASDASVTDIGFTVDDVQLDVTGSGATTYSIAGQVTASSSALAGATLSDGAGHSATTDASGNYAFSGLAAGSYTLTPTKSGCTFTPTSRSVTLPPSATSQNFTASCTTNAVTNGDFERGRGVGWTESSMQFRQVVTTGAAHGGTWLAQLGDGASGTGGESSQIYQTITVPTGSAKLTYWYKITSASGCSYNKATVILGTWTLKKYQPCATTATSGWVQETVNLAEYVGQTLKLTFFVETEFGGGTTFYVDDVVVSQGAPVTPPTPEPSASIVNGDFESGPSVGWTRTSTQGLTLIAQGMAHGGSWRAVLGNANYELSSIAQTVRIPTAGATLEYWYKISSEDVCVNDRAYVSIQTGSSSADLKKVYLCTSSITDTYVRDQLSLAAYAGQTVTLSFWVTNDADHLSIFYVDDVILLTGSVPTYTIAGQVTASGAALAGATLSDGAGHSVTTDASGNYLFSGLAAGSYTLTPTKSGCTFSPASRATALPPNATGLNFTATCMAPTYTIAGQVTASGAALAGATLSDGAGHSVTTDASGNYLFSELAAGSYTLTPTKSGCTFSPASRATALPPNATGLNFTATCMAPTYTIAGQVTASGAALAGATLSDGAGHSAITDASGNYLFSELAAGSYTLTPTKSGCTFSPASRATALPPSATGLNFTATCMAPTYTIAGQVTASGAALAGATLSDGAGHSAITDASGNYLFSGLAAGSYTLTPTKSGCTFTPGTRTVSVPPDASNQDFAATCATAHVKIMPGATTASVSGTFKVDLVVEGVTNLASYETVLVYDATLVQVTGVSQGTFLSSTGRAIMPVGAASDTTGRIQFGALTFGAPAGPNGGGVLASITFQAKAVGTTALRLQDVILADPNGGDLPAVSEDGQVRVTNCFGDFNGDHKVDIRDLQMMAAHWNCSAGQACYDAQFDVVVDGKIDIRDLQKIASAWNTTCSGAQGPARLAASTWPAQAASVGLRLLPTSTRIAAGALFTETLRLEDVTNLGAFQADLIYDPAVVEVEGVTLGGWLSSTGRTVSPVGPSIDNVAGRVTWGLFSFGTPGGVSGSGDVATIRFRAVHEGQTGLALEQIIVTDVQGNPLDVGSVTGSSAVVGADAQRRILLPLVLTNR